MPRRTPESGKLRLIDPPAAAEAETESPRLDAVITGINGNLIRLNEILFGYRDYAVIADKHPAHASADEREPSA